MRRLGWVALLVLFVLGCGPSEAMKDRARLDLPTAVCPPNWTPVTDDLAGISFSVPMGWQPFDSSMKRSQAILARMEQLSPSSGDNVLETKSGYHKGGPAIILEYLKDDALATGMVPILQVQVIDPGEKDIMTAIKHGRAFDPMLPSMNEQLHLPIGLALRGVKTRDEGSFPDVHKLACTYVLFGTEHHLWLMSCSYPPSLSNTIQPAFDQILQTIRLKEPRLKELNSRLEKQGADAVEASKAEMKDMNDQAQRERQVAAEAAARQAQIDQANAAANQAAMAPSQPPATAPDQSAPPADPSAGTNQPPANPPADQPQDTGQQAGGTASTG